MDVLKISTLFNTCFFVPLVESNFESMLHLLRTKFSSQRNGATPSPPPRHDVRAKQKDLYVGEFPEWRYRWFPATLQARCFGLYPVFLVSFVDHVLVHEAF